MQLIACYLHPHRWQALPAAPSWGCTGRMVLRPASQNVSDEKQEDSRQTLLHLLKQLVLRTLCETFTASSSLLPVLVYIWHFWCQSVPT